jgi:GNAT superfamily N-acetyltransferase
VIRPANTDDIELLRPLVQAYSEETAAQGVERNDALLLDAIIYGIRAGEAVVVAESAGDLIGFCAWVHLPMIPPGKVEGLGTYVMPEWRGAGVSSGLRAAAEAHAVAHGYRYVDGVYATGNEAGRESVMKQGFREVGVMVRRDFEGGAAWPG